MPADRKRLLMGAGAVVLLLAAWWFWPSTAPVAAIGDTGSSARPVAPKPGTDGVGPVGPVKLEALRSAGAEPGDDARNPFRFKPKPPPPPVRPVTPPSASVEPPRPMVPSGPPPPPPIPLKFIGVLERANGVKWAILSDGKSSVPMYGKDGDIIDGRYTIVKIGTESIEMTHADGRGRQVIRLNGQ
jgi:hypothetical protein